ncbi:hypothetical protein SISSUDRAFT_1037497 [Sistotremastrum suecicum HHB10207 ss-3]|uniref:Uncharacterized protein n=1 Tax=Sistotremastrum suecicum HHB10207 ss-3 TaxID=1314776 RepID=A0A165Y1T5_9AGAM|nr:hypothetical protein SISSUDRAFT_1037497 [Sistotremastrum suecicum HHB10207 ss-3]
MTYQTDTAGYRIYDSDSLRDTGSATQILRMTDILLCFLQMLIRPFDLNIKIALFRSTLPDLPNRSIHEPLVLTPDSDIAFLQLAGRIHVAREFRRPRKHRTTRETAKHERKLESRQRRRKQNPGIAEPRKGPRKRPRSDDENSSSTVEEAGSAYRITDVGTDLARHPADTSRSQRRHRSTDTTSLLDEDRIMASTTAHQQPDLSSGTSSAALERSNLIRRESIPSDVVERYKARTSFKSGKLHSGTPRDGQWVRVNVTTYGARNLVVGKERLFTFQQHLIFQLNSPNANIIPGISIAVSTMCKGEVIRATVPSSLAGGNPEVYRNQSALADRPINLVTAILVEQ